MQSAVPCHVDVLAHSFTRDLDAIGLLPTVRGSGGPHFVAKKSSEAANKLIKISDDLVVLPCATGCPRVSDETIMAILTSEFNRAD